MLPVVEQAVAYLREAGIAKSRFWAYVLVEDVEDAHRRVLALERMGVLPFAQPYWDFIGGEPTNEQKAFARWVNVLSVHKSCTWEAYNDSIGGESKLPKKCTEKQEDSRYHDTWRLLKKY